jgi:hypothetical protein
MLIEPAFVPFALALGLLFALLILEVIGLLLGMSLLGDTDLPELDLAAAETAFDIDPGLDVEGQIEAALDRLGAIDLAQTPEPDASGTALDVPGRGKPPFVLRLAAFLLVFGISGILIQHLAGSMTGAPMAWWLAAPIAAIPALWLGNRISQVLASVLPQTETAATRLQFLGGLRGVVSQGTARRGSPAEVRLRDRHDNIHHIRCEPLRDEDVILEGTEVLTLRRRIPRAERLRADGVDDWMLVILPIPQM